MLGKGDGRDCGDGNKTPLPSITILSPSLHSPHLCKVQVINSPSLGSLHSIPGSSAKLMDAGWGLGWMWRDAGGGKNGIETMSLGGRADRSWAMENDLKGVGG